jgi:hypothetical protein
MTSLNSQLSIACQQGDLEVVKSLLKNKDVDIHYKNDNPLICACLNNHKSIIAYLTSSSDLIEHAHLDTDDKALPVWIASLCNSEMIRYLLTSPELKTHININACDSIYLRQACARGDEEDIKYFLTSPDLKEHSNINAVHIGNKDDLVNNNSPLANVYNYDVKNKWNIIEYLITSEELKEKADLDTDDGALLYSICKKEDIEGLVRLLDIIKNNNIEHPNFHIANDKIFKYVCNNNQKITNYLILDYGIEQTEGISLYLEELPTNNMEISLERLEEIKDMFKTRDLYNGLNKKIVTKKNFNQTIKI